jgi:predicted RNA-binding Zn-ribbon protein involved in translation (DUF1610 family)
MKYQEAIQTINTERALAVLGLTVKKNGAYLYFPCPTCGNEAAIRHYGEKKNISYCPSCKSGDNIISLACKAKGMEFQEAKAFLIEKAAVVDKPIDQELKLNYELEWCDLMEKEGLNRELCQTIGIGRPKGKTMLSGCVAFTVHNEAGVKIAYYGIRIADRRPIFHKSFNPELYLFGYHAADPEEEVLVTTDLFSCLRHLAEGKQATCNFGLPYLSVRQMDLLSPFRLITFEWLFAEKNEIMLSVAQNIKPYHRFV